MTNIDVFALFYIYKTSYSSTICWKCSISPMDSFSYFVKNQVSLGMRNYSGSLNWYWFIKLSIFMPIPCNFYYGSSVVQLKIRDTDTSESFFILQECFSYPRCFVCPYQIEYCPFNCEGQLCCNFVKNCVVILMGIALNL